MCCPSRRPAMATRRCSAARMRGRGEQVGAGNGVDRGAVGPPQRFRFGDPSSGRARRHRPAGQYLVDEQVDRADQLRSAGTSAARIWRCASARTCQTCQVERRSSIAASTRSAAASSHAASVSRRRRWRRAERLLHHELHGVWPAEHLDGLGEPGRRAARPGCAVRVWRPGFPGWPAGPAASTSTGVGGRPWVALELGGELAPPGLDAGPPGRPALRSERGRRRRFPAPAASAGPGRAVRRTGGRGCRGGGVSRAVL